MATKQAYVIRLCKNGKGFKALPNVVDVGHRPTSVGIVIEEKWRVRGVISHSLSELVIDVNEV